MLKKSLVLVLFLFLAASVKVNASQYNTIEDLVFKSEKIDKSSGIRVPWNSANTSSSIFTKLDTAWSGSLIINIVHPKNYSLFLNKILIYRAKAPDSIQFTLEELRKIGRIKQLELEHFSDLLNSGNLKARLIKKTDSIESSIIDKKERIIHKPYLESIFLGFFFALAMVRILSKREFDFYFSGNFLRSPRLTIEKFLGDSINPLLLLLAILVLAVLLNTFIYDFDYFNYEFRTFFGLRINNNWIKTGLLSFLIVLYLFLKRSFYLFYLWIRQETRNFSSLWRTYLLSFSNLSFWYFLLCSIPLLLLSNLELGNYFQILFFIFAALNAVGGIMTYLNFNIKADLLTISGILAIDVFPIILLVHLLTF